MTIIAIVLVAMLALPAVVQASGVRFVERGTYTVSGDPDFHINATKTFGTGTQPGITTRVRTYLMSHPDAIVRYNATIRLDVSDPEK